MQERYKTCASTDVANSQLTKMKSSNYPTIIDYCDRFERTARDSSFDDEAKIYFFVNGLPLRIQDRIRMIHPRIRKLEELIATVASNLEIERRIYGPDPMDVDGRRTRPLTRGLGTSRYPSHYQQNHYEGNDRGSTSTTTKPKKCFICKKIRSFEERLSGIRRQEKESSKIIHGDEC